MAEDETCAVSIGAQTVAALCRALLLAALSVGLAGRLRVWLIAQTGPMKMLGWTLLLAPLFTPSALLTQILSTFVIGSWSREAFYLGVLALKLIPVAVLVRMLVPSPLSAEAHHCYEMLVPASSRDRVRFHLRAAGAGPWLACGLVFALTFTDFELAAFFHLRTWPIAVLEAQGNAASLLGTLRIASWPLLVELLALLLFTGAAWQIFHRPHGR